MTGYKSPYSVTMPQRSMRLTFPMSLIEKTADGTLGPNTAWLCSSLALSSVSPDWGVPECRAPPVFQSCSWQFLLSHLFWSPSLSQSVCVFLTLPSPCTTLLCVFRRRMLALRSDMFTAAFCVHFMCTTLDYWSETLSSNA